MSSAIKKALVGGGPTTVSGRLRLARWAMVREEFPDLARMSVLDLGGTVESWRTGGLRPERLVLLNPAKQMPADGVEVVRGDACQPPEAIRRERFDLVFSNSVIEHVGGHANRQRFAETALTLGDRLWVQTPYRYFPIEPHFVAPGLHFLPLRLQVEMLHLWPLVPVTTRESTLRRVQGVELLSVTQMRGYFPGCEILRERVAGLPKSLIALR